MNIRKIFVIASLVAMVSIPLIGTSIYAATNANTYNVNSTADKVDANPGDNICQTSSAGECTLRAAVMEANAHSGTETIEVKAGTYNFSIGGTDGDTPNAAKGDLDITDSVDIHGGGRGLTFVDAQDKDRIFDIHSFSEVSMSSMTLRNGKITTDLGSAIRGRGNALYLEYLIVESNEGAAAISNKASDMTMYRMTVRNNSGGNTGLAGGIYSGGVLIMSQSVVHDNQGFHGGGLYAENSTVIVNSTFSGNTAQYRGGAIEFGNDDLPILLDLSNVTITNNRAGVEEDFHGSGAGGVDNQGFLGDTVKVRNSIIAGNFDDNFDTADDDAVATDCYGSFISEGYNFIGDNNNCTGFNKTGDQVGTHNNPLNPKLAALASNGGYAYSHMPLDNSPVIDKGNYQGCVDRFGTALVTDQRGLVRPVDGDNVAGNWCDIGAVEFKSTSVPTKTPKPIVCDTKPAKPTLDTPANDSEITKPQVALNWDGVVCATKYKVAVRQDTKKGLKADKKTVQTSEYITKKLAKKHTYFWNIKACNDFGCTKSQWFTFDLK